MTRTQRERIERYRRAQPGYDWAPKTPCAQLARAALARLSSICGYCGDGTAAPGERCRDCADDHADVRARESA